MYMRGHFQLIAAAAHLRRVEVYRTWVVLLVLRIKERIRNNLNRTVKSDGLQNSQRRRVSGGLLAGAQSPR